MSKQEEKLILFDCDGVIIDSFRIVFENVQRFLQEHGATVVDEQKYKTFFETNPLQAIFAYTGIQPNGDTISKKQMEDFFHSYEKAQIFPGMKELLTELAEKNTLVIITSTITDFITEKFDEEGIGELFAAYLGPRSAIHKDAKIQMALDEFGFSEDKTVFISDTSGDILEAKKTGVKTIGVTWGYHDAVTLKKANPNKIAESIEDLKTYLYE